MKKITVDEFNQIPLRTKVMVYAPDISNKPIKGTIEGNEYLKEHYVQLNNGDEVFVHEIKGIWKIN